VDVASPYNSYITPTKQLSKSSFLVQLPKLAESRSATALYESISEATMVSTEEPSEFQFKNFSTI